MPDTLLIDAVKQCLAANGPAEESKVSAAQWDKVLALVLAADPDGVKKKDEDGRLVLHYATEMQAPLEVILLFSFFNTFIHSVH